MITERTIEIPTALPAVLDALHDSFGVETPHKSIRNGTQVDLSFVAHPVVTSFLKSVSDKPLIGAWTNRIPKGGRHVRQTHPRGKNSNICYVRVPDPTTGKIVFYGEENRIIEPKAGMLLSFPYDLEHEVTTYEGDESRLTVVFDTQ